MLALRQEGTYTPWFDDSRPATSSCTTQPIYSALLNIAASPKGEGRVTVIRSFVDEAVVRSLRSRDHRPMIFIFDIRASSDSIKDFDSVERCVEQDMTRQRAWAEELRPYLSMLKFRLPWALGRRGICGEGFWFRLSRPARPLRHGLL